MTAVENSKPESTANIRELRRNLKEVLILAGVEVDLSVTDIDTGKLTKPEDIAARILKTDPPHLNPEALDRIRQAADYKV